MTDDKYRKQLGALLEGIGMPEHERLLLLGGLVMEIIQAPMRKIGLLNSAMAPARRVLEAHETLEKELKRFAEALEDLKEGD